MIKRKKLNPDKPIRPFKGIWIPIDLWENKELTLQEKIFMVEISSLDGPNGCYASNKYFSKFFNLTPQRCSKIIQNLKKKGYITVSYNRKGKQILNRIIGVSIILDRGINFSVGGYQQKVKENNIIYNKKINPKGFTKKGNKKQPTPKKPKLNGNTPPIKYFKAYLPKEYFKNKELLPAIKDFITHREEKNSPLTELAIKRICSNHKKGFTSEELQTALESSIISGYKGVFPKKEYNNGYSGKPKSRTGSMPESEKRLAKKNIIKL